MSYPLIILYGSAIVFLISFLIYLTISILTFKKQMNQSRVVNSKLSGFVKKTYKYHPKRSAWGLYSF
jgi:hypothetical protein